MAVRRFTFLLPVLAAFTVGALITGGGASTAADPVPEGAVFVVLEPFRLFDTRTGEGMPGGVPGKLAAGTSTTLSVRGGAVSDDAVAVVMNVTYVNAEGRGWVRVTAAGAGDTGTANLNKTFAGPEPNEVTTGLSTAGEIDITNSTSATHLIGDVLGYYVPDPGADQFGTNTGTFTAGRGGECTIGEAMLFAGVVGSGLPANGQLLRIVDHTALFSLMGTTYGGDGRVTFALPDLRSATPDGLTYFICTVGVFPSRS